MKTVELKLLIICIVAGCLVAAGPSTVFAKPHFSIITEQEWEEVLDGNGIPSVRPLEEYEWEDHMNQWENGEVEGEPYPENDFQRAELWVYRGGGYYDPCDPCDPCGIYFYPEDAGMVMAWGDPCGPPPNEPNCSSAWRFDYGEDPDLSNSTITITVWPPQRDSATGTVQVTSVSFGIVDIAGVRRSWWWSCPNPIPWNTGTTVTIDCSKTGVNATTPPANGYTAGVNFNIKQSQVFDVDENFTWGGPWGTQVIPPPGQMIFAYIGWNYWHDLIVTPNPPPSSAEGEYKYYTKWSQRPVVFDPNEDPPLFLGWDEYANYEYGPILADDWLCEDDRPVTDIHWWGSFIGWDKRVPPPVVPKAFNLGIWTDVPAGVDPCYPFSHPNEMIWHNYCDNWVWNYAGRDKSPTEMIADNPTISHEGDPGADFGWDNEWWFRDDVTAIIFTFDGIDTNTIDGNQVLVNFDLGVTNHQNGDFGLDGLVDITINPGDPDPNMTYTTINVLLDNVDAENDIGNWPGTGTGQCPHTTESYETTAWIGVGKNYIQGGTLVIKVHRHTDTLDNNPVAPCGMHPIDMSTTPPTVPIGCYDFNDAHTVHINVKAMGPVDPLKHTAKSGEVTIWDTDENESCFQFNQLLSQDEWFFQEPNDPCDDDPNKTVYWLSIAPIYDPCDPPPTYPWGWKTRPHFFNDDAVRIWQIIDPLSQIWPPIPPEPTLGCKWLHGDYIWWATEKDSWDLAFELTTNVPAYEDNPIPGDLNADKIVNFFDFAILANNWLKTAP